MGLMIVPVDFDSCSFFEALEETRSYPASINALVSFKSNLTTIDLTASFALQNAGCTLLSAAGKLVAFPEFGSQIKGHRGKDADSGDEDQDFLTSLLVQNTSGFGVFRLLAHSDFVGFED